MLTVSKLTARRFILGRQGLWPGRRWAGKAGAARAMRAGEYLQLDPLRPVARSHDLVLHSRVEGYREGMFEELLYVDREFFDWGGWLAAIPMDELPYWRVMMDRHAVGRWGSAFAQEHADVIEQVRTALAERGPLMNRDFAPGKRFQGAYRSTKDTGLALYYLWIKGEVMTFDRRRFERVYHLRERVAPPQYSHVASAGEAERHVALKAVAMLGIARPSALTRDLRRKLDKEEAAAFVANLVENGELVDVKVEGIGSRVMRASDIPLIEDVAADRIPDAWTPIGPTTDDEVAFLSPLDMVSARGRAKDLFDFEYIWEVYKPAHLRRWGYYTMPVLYQDRLVARIEPRMDRKRSVLMIDGFWPEEAGLSREPAFGRALALAVRRLAEFAGAKSVEAPGIQDSSLRKRVG